MALKYLSTEAMIALSQPWLSKKKDRQVLERSDYTKGLLLHLEQAVEALISSQKETIPENSKEIGQLSEDQVILDTIHDKKCRGVFGLLTALTELSEDAADVETLLELRNRLFPQGMSVVNWSYLREAGNAQTVQQLISKEDRDLLSQIKVSVRKQKTSADVQVNAWLKSGIELGELEVKKKQLEGEQSSIKSKSQGGGNLQARALWIRTVNAMVSMLDFDETVNDSERNQLLHPLKVAVEQAQKTRTLHAQKKQVIDASETEQPAVDPE
jgi:hypothetical protein